MTIEPAKSSYLKPIKNLTEACAIAMQQQRIFQWNNHYPSLEKLSADIEKRGLYILKSENDIKGIIVLTDLMDEEYVPVNWITENKKSLYPQACNPSRILGKRVWQDADGFC